MAAPRRRSRALWLPRPLSSLVLGVLVAGSIGAFALSRAVLDDQEERLLSERAAAVQALLVSSIDSIDSSLRALGPVGVSEDPSAPALFEQSAERLVEGATVAVGVASEADGGLRVVAATGDGPVRGDALSGRRAALAERALALDEPDLVGDLVVDGPSTRLVLARRVEGSRAVVYRESAVDPTTPAPSTPDSPFRELRVVLYASPQPDPDRLIVTTEARLPLDGRVAHLPFPAGADEWLLAVEARGSLVGSFAEAVPWLLLGGGLVTAVLALIFVESLVRRRTYAMALVAERTSELEQTLSDLQEAQEAAEHASRAKSEFLSRMSHELRTPLNAVLGFGQLLELDPLSEPQRDAVEHILKGGHHLLDLINEVLDISRIEAGELSLSPESVFTADVVREAADLIRPLAAERGIQLVVDGSASCDSHVLADRQRLKQVLLNLLANAVKYNRPRGTVAVTCEPAGESRVRINVVDTGMGIPTERLSLLFLPFERLGAEQTGEEGTGIGLALSKRLTEAMGGTLEATSVLGQGSTFTIDLPRVEGPVERFERLNGVPAPVAVVETPRQVILHIEDNLSNLTLVERVLAQRPGVEIVAAMQGRLGLELAREHRPALVLLDLHLPDMGGDQVLQRLRDEPTTASIPVVIVSADATPGRVRHLLSTGAAGYLTKPIDVRELLRFVDEAITS